MHQNNVILVTDSLTNDFMFMDMITAIFCIFAARKLIIRGYFGAF